MAAFLPAKKSRPYEGPECPRCQATLPEEARRAGTAQCPRCHGSFDATWFAPLPRRLVAVASVAVAGPDGSAACARHAGNVAEAACERCGSYICGLCRVDVEGRVLCAACFDHHATAGSLQSAVTRVPDWRGRAIGVVIVGFLLFFMVPLVGVAAIYYSSKGLAAKKAAGETDELTAFRVTLALGILQVVAGTAIVAAFIASLSQ